MKIKLKGKVREVGMARPGKHFADVEVDRTPTDVWVIRLVVNERQSLALARRLYKPVTITVEAP